MNTSVRLGSSSLRLAAWVTGLAILFQYGHFLEHIIQVGAWMNGYTQAPYMTDIGYRISDALGTAFFPNESPERIDRLGMELLHLIGNAGFLIGVLGLWFFVRTRLMLVALIIHGFHLIEHISLTLSSVYIDKAIGLTTLYGMPMSNTVSVAYRVWSHFALNAIPTVLVTCALIALFNRRRRAAPSSAAVSATMPLTSGTGFKS